MNSSVTVPTILLSVVLIVASVHRAAAQDLGDLSPQIRLEAPGVRLTMIAEHPDIVTPTGIDVDDSGNIWAIACHTHFRPDDYVGPDHDEVIRFGADGSRAVFYQKTTATMDLELGPDGWVYLAQRDRIVRVRDTDSDGVGDQQQDIAVLDTEADYPHNGLSGMAWHPSGDLIFSLGENFWKSWTLTSSAGDVVTGSGEGGIFRCKADGSSMRRIAKGFWNPFGICVRSDGTMFAAENDPGSRPPCRLLHIVPGGDYGYQRAYGNASVHPFVCWNGQLRGTLPMLHSLGEAPCGIAPLGNGLVVPSWTDHRIDFYALTARGASFETKPTTLIQGGRSFRPTCIVQASPTVFYLTDWVYGSYKLHGKGRVWKLEIDPETATWLGPMERPAATKEATLASQLRSGHTTLDDDSIFQLARSTDPFLASAAIDALAQQADRFSIRRAGQLSPADRMSLLIAMRKSGTPAQPWIDHFWEDPDPEVRFECLRWIADQRLTDYLDHVEQLLVDPGLDYRLFEATLATRNTLHGKPDQGIVDTDMLLRRVSDTSAPARTRAFALRLIKPTDGKLKPKLWDELLASGDQRLIRELTRSLVTRGDAAAQTRLQQIIRDPNIATSIRADALAGLSGSTAESKSMLLEFAASNDPALREEAARSLRFTQLDPDDKAKLQKLISDFPESADLYRAAIDPASVKQDRPSPDDLPAWQARLAAIERPVDLRSGRRIFHHSQVGKCASCHRHSGRGNVLGPDLSAATTDGNANRLLQALLQPSRDVDPQYYPWALVTEDGQVFTGILLRDGGGGTEYFRDNTGRERKFATTEIVQRKPLKTSMMPDGLVDLMTDREIRDVLAFLDRSIERN